MDDLMDEASRLLAVPEVWERLLQSGFFLVDFARGVSTTSRVMVNLGHQPRDFDHKTFRDHVHPSDLPTYQSLWERVWAGHENEFFAEYRIRTKKGGYRWVQTLGIVLDRGPDGTIARLLGLDRDIGLRKQSETLLHSRFLDLERRYLMSESLRIAGSLVTASLEIESTIPVILEQAQALFSFTGARVWAHRDGALDLLGQEEDQGDASLLSPSTSSLVLKVVQDNTPVIIDNLARLREHEKGPQASWIGIPLNYQGELRGVMEFWHEETGYFRSEHVWPAVAFADNVAVGLFNAGRYRDTREASETDPLTGLATRRRFERLGPELFRSAVDQSEDLALVVIDIDLFKAINDNYGHTQGDAVLRNFALTCQSVLRKGDLMCRYGGDEFVALLPQTDREGALLVAQRLASLFKERAFSFGHAPVTLSQGIATLAEGRFSDLKALFDAADAALYRVKARGRDGVSW